MNDQLNDDIRRYANRATKLEGATVGMLVGLIVGYALGAQMNEKLIVAAVLGLPCIPMWLAERCSAKIASLRDQAAKSQPISHRD